MVESPTLSSASVSVEHTRRARCLRSPPPSHSTPATGWRWRRPPPPPCHSDRRIHPCPALRLHSSLSSSRLFSPSLSVNKSIFFSPFASSNRLCVRSCATQGLPRQWCWGVPAHSPGWRAFHANRRRRSTLLCTVHKGPEKSFKKTIEVDKLIDMLRDANPRELDQIVVENILAFDEGFWVRLAARIDLCKLDDDKKDYEELAENVMNIVDRLVHKTDEKIEQSTDVLKAIISPVMHEGEEVKWPPRDPEALELMEKEISNREKEGQLDEGFLSEVNAQLRQAKEDGDKPGLQAMLQKVLQLYASKYLQKRSYAYKGGEVVVPEKFLESVIQAPENEWNKLLLDGLTVGKGDVSPEELYAVIKKRIERVLIRTEGGSYQQRVLVEYLNEIQARAEEIVKVLQGPAV